jgi:hypothetical protein
MLEMEPQSMREESRWRRWGSYALGMVIESAAVGVIALAALLVIYLVKIIVK